jgi:hypothetical protein
MVTLPKDFVATRYPGYFWHVTQQKLYSLKVTGELRPMKFETGGTFGWRVIQPGYKVSVDGQRRKLTIAYLRGLKPTNTVQEIKVHM